RRPWRAGRRRPAACRGPASRPSTVATGPWAGRRQRGYRRWRLPRRPRRRSPSQGIGVVPCPHLRRPRAYSHTPMGDEAQMTAVLLDSPHVGVDLHPDVRAGLLPRRTFRTFEHRPVPATVRASVLEAARFALAAEDAGVLRFIAIDDSELKRALFRLTRESKDISNHWEGLFKPSGLRGYVQYWPNTPICVAVCADPAAGPPRPEE